MQTPFFLGKTIRESGIRDKYHCMIAGVEREDGTLMVPDVNAPFEEGDVVWVVGEKENVYQLVDQKKRKNTGEIKAERLFLLCQNIKIRIS